MPCAFPETKGGPGVHGSGTAATIGIKRIVCFANARKLVGRCTAGREWLNGEGIGRWIRTVSDRQNGDVSEYERLF